MIVAGGAAGVSAAFNTPDRRRRLRARGTGGQVRQAHPHHRHPGRGGWRASPPMDCRATTPISGELHGGADARRLAGGAGHRPGSADVCGGVFARLLAALIGPGANPVRALSPRQAGAVRGRLRPRRHARRRRVGRPDLWGRLCRGQVPAAGQCRTRAGTGVLEVDGQPGRLRLRRAPAASSPHRSPRARASAPPSPRSAPLDRRARRGGPRHGQLSVRRRAGAPDERGDPDGDDPRARPRRPP